MSELDSSWVDRDDPASRMAAALEAADAIGRERVSEGQATALVEDVENDSEWLGMHSARASNNKLSKCEQDEWNVRYGNRESTKAYIIALLTAAPAERETGEQP